MQRPKQFWFLEAVPPVNTFTQKKNFSACNVGLHDWLRWIYALTFKSLSPRKSTKIENMPVSNLPSLQNSDGSMQIKTESKMLSLKPPRGTILAQRTWEEQQRDYTQLSQLHSKTFQTAAGNRRYRKHTKNISRKLEKFWERFRFRVTKYRKWSLKLSKQSSAGVQP